MGDDDTEKRALDDCQEKVDELKHENADLKEENEELRESSSTFGELAERLSEELRKDPDDVETATPIEADPDGVF